jgi:hypothetical protein
MAEWTRSLLLINRDSANYGVLSANAWFHQLSSCAFRAMQETRPDIGRQCIRCASFYLSLRLLKIEPHLSKLGGFLRVHSGPQISFL